MAERLSRLASETNVPRYPTLLQVMVASKKAIEDVQLSSLKESDYPESGFEVLRVTVQMVNRKRLILDGRPEEAAKKLVEALKEEGVL